MFEQIRLNGEIMGELIAQRENPFYYAFDNSLVSSSAVIDRRFPVYVSFDFNVNPLCAIICQHNDEVNYDSKAWLNIIGEIVIANSDIEEGCSRIQALYPGSVLWVTGDPSGRARTALKSNMNYFTAIREYLGLGAYQIKVLTNAPSHKDSSVLVNSILARHPNLKINPSCSHFINDLRFTTKTSERKKNKKNFKIEKKRKWSHCFSLTR